MRQIFSFSVSHTVISLYLLCVSWHLFLSTYHPFCLLFIFSLNPSTLPAILDFLFLFHLAFVLKVVSPLPQFSGACCLHHAVTPVTNTIASAVWETEVESVNVEQFDATLWLAPTMDITDESIHHKWNESTVNWVAMKKSFMQYYQWRYSLYVLFFPERSLTQTYVSSWWEHQCFSCQEMLLPGIGHKQATWNAMKLLRQRLDNKMLYQGLSKVKSDSQLKNCN